MSEDIKKTINKVKNFKQFVNENIEQKLNKFKLINMDGELNLEEVLFGYEDINSQNLYIVTDNDGLYITYELHFDVKNTTKKSMFSKSVKKIINKAIWLGESNDDIIQNGKLTNNGDMFLGANETKKRKLTSSELNGLLNKEYHFEA